MLGNKFHVNDIFKITCKVHTQRQAVIRVFNLATHNISFHFSY